MPSLGTHITSFLKLMVELMTQKVPEWEQFYNWICFFFSLRSHPLSLCDRFYYFSKHFLPLLWRWVWTPTLSVSGVAVSPALATKWEWQWRVILSRNFKSNLLRYMPLRIWGCLYSTSYTILIDTIVHTKLLSVCQKTIIRPRSDPKFTQCNWTVYLDFLSEM